MIKTLSPQSGLVFSEADHTYYYDRVQVPSPTMLFDEEALCAISEIPEDILVWKSGLGRAVHFAAHLFDIGELRKYSLDQQILPYLEAYKKFKSETGFDPIYSEQIVYSRRWRFATTIDRVGLFKYRGKDGLSVVELKCTAGMYPTVGPQTAAHKIALEEVTGERAKHRYAVQLLPDESYRIHDYEDPQDETTFFSALHLHHWKVKHRIFKPKRMEPLPA